MNKIGKKTLDEISFEIINRSTEKELEDLISILSKYLSVKKKYSSLSTNSNSFKFSRTINICDENKGVIKELFDSIINSIPIEIKVENADLPSKKFFITNIDKRDSFFIFTFEQLLEIDGAIIDNKKVSLTPFSCSFSGEEDNDKKVSLADLKYSPVNFNNKD